MRTEATVRDCGQTDRDRQDRQRRLRIEAEETEDRGPRLRTEAVNRGWGQRLRTQTEDGGWGQD